nr:hypothetical protein [Tanacetum cinerariifolium]
MIFADDIVLIAKSTKWLTNRLEKWRKALENKGQRTSYAVWLRVLADHESSSEQGGSGEIKNVELDLWFLALGWHSKEIHVTWAHLEKKRTQLRTYTKSMKKYCSQSVEMASQA